MKKVISILLVLLVMVGAAQAASQVRYEGGAEEFIYLPGSAFSDTDLFEGFKGVMPGDVISQRITIRNTSDKEVRIFLRADPVEEKHRDFLSRMNLQVSTRDGQIFDAATSETGQLTENTLLGTFKQGGTTELMLTLTVPYDLGNDFMATMGVVPWVFLAEEVPEDDTPHTGDDFDLGVWLLAAAMILAAIAYVVIRMKREQAAN